MVCGSGCCRPINPPLDSNTVCPRPISKASSSIQDNTAEQGGCCYTKYLAVDGNRDNGCCDTSTTELATTEPSCNGQVQDSSSSGILEQVARLDCCGSGSVSLKNSLLGGTYSSCGGPTEQTKDDIGYGKKDKATADDCCAPSLSKQGREKSRCTVSEQSQVENDPKGTGCCDGKSSPCCDVSCLDRIALRECEKIISSEGSEHATHECKGSRNGKPCSQHISKTREKYTTTLEALGCICRALLALGHESCCAPLGGVSGQQKRSSKTTSIRRSTSVDSVRSVRTYGKSSGCCSKKQTDYIRCRTNDKSRANNSTCSKSCCTSTTDCGVTDNRDGACCTEKEVKRPKETFAAVAPAIDPEKGLSGKEHVILSVSGMTCTGCETKLKRTLATFGSVKNLKTSLVLSRAEFDLDLRLGALEEVTKHLERTTEFKCEKISNQGTNIDLIAPCDPTEFVNQPWPDGVTEMRVVDKKVVNVVFDANAIGARELVGSGWGSPLDLAPLRNDPMLEAGGRHVRNVGLATLLSIILTVPVLVMAWAPLPNHEIAYSSASLCLATIVQCAIAGPFYPKALKSLIFSRMVEMDLLIVLSTSAAYIFSVVSFGYLVTGKPLSTGEFFETSTLLVTLIMVGRYISALARQKAVESISIRSLQAPTAILVDEAGEAQEIDVRLLQYGDIFKVAPDARIPTDGTVISGVSEIDESMITGESRPVAKATGSSVIAGSINGSGALTIRLTRLPEDNTVSVISGMVDEAKLSKPKVQDTANHAASYFVPTVVVITIITFIIWVAIGVGVRKQSGAKATVRAITYAITVLVVSCPCAIGLAAPMAIVIASGVAARRGVIFKSADGIEVAYKTSHVVFDKTSTLTQGKPSVAREVYKTDDPESAKSLLLGLVSGIKHPISAAIAAHLNAQGVSASAVSDQKALTGKGVEGTASGFTIRAGNSHWLNVSSSPSVQSVLAQGYTAFCFTINDSLKAVFALEDALRPDTAATIQALHKRGISVHVVSGDDDGVVRSVATSLNIPCSNTRSHCDPVGKRAYVQNLLSQTSPSNKPKKPIVMFCGDGTNDAVALAQATIGVHMNEGTDVAKSAADVVLTRPSLTGVLIAITISKKASNRIKFNFAWSFVYNLFAILLGAGVFVKTRIPPEFAGLGELVSVLPVIAASVLLHFSRG